MAGRGAVPRPRGSASGTESYCPPTQHPSKMASRRLSFVPSWMVGDGRSQASLYKPVSLCDEAGEAATQVY